MIKKPYLVDSNTFITPYKTYYPFDFAPSYWVFLHHHIEIGNIALSSKVYDEICMGTDELSTWIRCLSAHQIDHRTPDVLKCYGEVLSYIQAATSVNRNLLYNDKALKEWADNNRADAWLVATAKAKTSILVTFERPNSSLGTIL
jgi:hypothetical protein